MKTENKKIFAGFWLEFRLELNFLSNLVRKGTEAPLAPSGCASEWDESSSTVVTNKYEIFKLVFT